MNASERGLMQLAIEAASQAVGVSNPNPHVGCVLAWPDGQVVQGHTQAVGGAHAEAMALQQARTQGLATQHATAYVTLEPCAHHGRTPPCSQALVAAGISKVVVAGLDPNPQVAGQGLAQLRQAGIEVVLLPFNDPLAKAARDINLGFFSRMLRQRPWVRLKVAISMDGQTALHNGQSQWLTSDAARQDVHHWRAQSCAILTGIGTVLADNPMMNVRLPHTTRQPALVVLDRQLRTPANAALFQTPRPIYVAHQVSANPQRQAALTQAGAQLWCIDSSSNTAATAPHHTTPQLGALMQHMVTQGWNNLHLEAGATLNASLLQADWVDEMLIYMAPKLLGQGMPLAHLPQWAHLQDTLGFEWLDCHMVGQDMRLRARPAGRTDFLNALDVPLNLPQ